MFFTVCIKSIWVSARQQRSVRAVSWGNLQNAGAGPCAVLRASARCAFRLAKSQLRGF